MDGFAESGAGPVPRLRRRPTWRDRLGTLRARAWYKRRNDYTVVPGLYCVGRPDASSPVLVTANYKLTFDTVRYDLADVNAWLLVIDSGGINVWCAAGKQLFSTAEVARMVRRSGLERVVGHRRLILPQLSATGVEARKLKGLCGFEAEFGPVRTSDIPAYLEGGADEAMRRVTFTARERMALVGVELTRLVLPFALTMLGAAAVSGFGPDVYSLERASSRGLLPGLAILAGILAGNLLVPWALRHLPGRAFALKGATAGLLLGFPAALAGSGLMEGVALALASATVASWFGMNFTGSTPFTSPTGVEREMRRAMPVQALAALIAVVLWVWAPFA